MKSARELISKIKVEREREREARNQEGINEEREAIKSFQLSAEL